MTASRLAISHASNTTSTTRPCWGNIDGSTTGLLQDALDLLHGVLRAHLGEDAGELALLVDDERGADDAHVLLAVERLLAPRVPRLRDRVIGVGEQREAERVLVVELQLLLGRVGADADDRDTEPLQLRVRVAQLARLRRATGRVGLRVEVHDQLAGP